MRSSARPWPRPRRRDGGFSLLELTVASAILILALLLASALLVESARVFAGAARELREPDDVIALRQLVEDVRAAAPVGGWGGGGAPLELAGVERTTSWELVEERLERSQVDRFGADLGTRVLLDRVVTFRWAPSGAGRAPAWRSPRPPRSGGRSRPSSKPRR